MNNAFTFAVYFAPMLVIYLMFVRRRAALEKVSHVTKRDSIEAGLTQPASLHPVVDPVKCIGCESCVNACPEFPKHQVLGLVNNKAELVSPTDCIGHGLCKTVCPTGAITLVFGTAERGIDIPTIGPDFATNVPGVYVAGELGGMGLIRNAIEQGRQSIGHIAAKLSGTATVEGALDVLIVGAGPAGLAATLGAMELGLTHITIEQNALGGTVANFPRGKLVMTAPAELPLVGTVRFTETSKEELVGFWHQVQRDTNLKVQTGERLLEVQQDISGGLKVVTDKGEYLTRSVLLALGRRGTPRQLGVPGEHLSKVTYSMIDPRQYESKHVLVVGGGDSALEAACSIAEETDAVVSLSYRSDAFGRAKKKNRERIAALEQEGRLNVLLSSQLTNISETTVCYEQAGAKHELTNDAVIVCAGGILPTGLLQDIGINMETKYGTA